MTKEEEKKFEKEFDKDYPPNDMNDWTIGIIAAALGHNQKNGFKDASYLTKKLRKNIQTLLTAQREEFVRIAEEVQWTTGDFYKNLFKPPETEIGKLVRDAYLLGVEHLGENIIKRLTPPQEGDAKK